MPQRPFRFAVQTFSAPTGAEWRDRARKVESLGYSALHLADHFLGPGPALDATNHPLQELAAVPAMAAAAAATETLRIGCRVFCNDYRHPVMLAKEAATLDLLSDGRLELGLGAGWLQAEYESVGMSLRRGEAAASTAWRRSIAAREDPHGRGTGRASRARLTCASSELRGGSRSPVQKPHPPIMIGGGSAKRVLSARVPGRRTSSA